MERWEFLKPDGLRFVWDDDLFPPGLDTFLIASMPELKSNMRVCDLGSGTGLLSVILFQRQPDIYITGIEIQLEAVKLANQCAEENKLRNRFYTICADLRNLNLNNLNNISPFDLVITNPPYYPAAGRASPENIKKKIARTEYGCNLLDLVKTAAKILRTGGKFCLVHKPERLTDLLYYLRANNLEPKRLRFVNQKPDAAPSLILLEARRGGKPGLSVEKPLILYHSDGSYTPELNQIYFRD